MDLTHGQTAPIYPQPNPSSPNESKIIFAFEYMKSENSKLNEEICSLKNLFQQINVTNNPSPPKTTSPGAHCNVNSKPSSSPSQRKSLHPDKLNMKSKNSSALDLDNTYIGDINQKLNDGKSLVPKPPNDEEINIVEGFFNVSPEPPMENASIFLQQQQITPVKANSKVDSDYIMFIPTTMRRWGIPWFTMYWDN
ncbi:hypothetical protein O181_025252 [Austropuccinia psidii MF-1]|uniref:Uncharacterized protein n=1 Tax=Austropuccinia psidii MF-1 TaxID=1389203 RepID=A0A9Q3CN57_9BASI|nr:hypothetical protein [Austropuccinia psidii MF-1]